MAILSIAELRQIISRQRGDGLVRLQLQGRPEFGHRERRTGGVGGHPMGEQTRGTLVLMVLTVQERFVHSIHSQCSALSTIVPWKGLQRHNQIIKAAHSWQRNMRKSKGGEHLPRGVRKKHP